MRRSPLHAGRVAGFTLFEVLVAVAILAIVSALALGGYSELVSQSERLKITTNRTRAVQLTMLRLQQDFAELEPRPVREALGDSREPSLRSDGRAEAIAELTRSGWTNPAGLPRPTLQRVAWRIEDDKLRRDYWVVLDRTLGTEPVSTVMLDQVRSVSMRFMDGNQGWHEQWPPLGYSGPDAPQRRPIAVEVTLELADWGTIVRLIEVAG